MCVGYTEKDGVSFFELAVLRDHAVKAGENGFVGFAEGAFLLIDRADTRWGALRSIEAALHYGRCKKAWLGLPASIAWMEG